MHLNALLLRSVFLQCGILLLGVLPAHTQTPFWQPTGGPGGGSIHALAITPGGTVLAVAGSALEPQLFHSIDGGQTWSVLLSPEGGIRTVAVSPTGTVIAVPWQGAMLRSNDDGQTWQPLAYPGTYVRALAFDPEGRLWAGGDVVYRSEDDGQTWEALNLEVLQVHGFAFMESGAVVVATSEGLYRSQNDGASWTELTSSLNAQALMVHPDGSLFVGVAGLSDLDEPSGLFRLEEGGEVVLAGLEGLSVVALVADAEGRLFAGTSGACTGYVCFPPAGVYGSVDGGETWTQAGLISTPVPALAIDAHGTLFAGTQGLLTNTGDLLSRGLLHSTDHGATWTPTNQGISHAQIYGLYPGPAGVLYAAADHSLYRSTDHGAHWAAIYTDEPSDEMPYPPHYKLGVHPEGELFLLSGHPVITTGGIPVLYMEARLLRSSDQGQTWIQVEENLGVVGPLVVTAAGTLLVATPEGTLRSTDRGETWTSAAAGLPEEPVVALEVVDNGPVFAATFSPQSLAVSLFRSTDDGESWTTIGSLERVLFPEALALSARDAETLYAGSHVFRFIQPETPWATSELDFFVRELAVDAEGRLYAASRDGVFHSLNDGATWEPLGERLPYRLDLQVLAVDTGGFLYAGGEQGLFRSITPVSTATTPAADVPVAFVLEASYPNPFRQVTHIPFTLARTAPVTLTVYDLLGREQAVLLEEALLPAGRHEVVWRAEGRPSGTYVYQVVAGHTVRAGSMILLR